MLNDVNERIKNLFAEEENRPKFTNTTTLEEFTPEEKAEIEAQLRKIRAQTPAPPQKVWHWHFVGVMLLMCLTYFLEFLILWAIITWIVPFAINIEWMTGTKALAITSLISVYRIRKTLTLFNFFVK